MMREAFVVSHWTRVTALTLGVQLESRGMSHLEALFEPLVA